jgi:hypothetical protein
MLTKVLLPGQEVYADFEYPVIAPGDTVWMVILKIDENGKLDWFPESARFEAGMIEGCGGGNLIAGESMDKYFYDVPQPILFLADSTILDTSITVGVRVGLIEDTTIIGSSRPVNGTGGEIQHKRQRESKNLAAKNNIKEKMYNYSKERLITLEKKLIGTKPKLKTNTKGNGNNPPLPSNPNEDYCFNGIFETTTNTNAEVVVEGDECGKNAPKCSTQVEPPTGFGSNVEFRNEYIKPGFIGRNLCKLYEGSGFTWIRYDGWIKLYSASPPNLPVPVEDEFYSPYNIETCYNEENNNGEGAYQYKLKTINKEDDLLYINFIISECEKFSKPITSESQLYEIPEGEICKALTDFELTRYYPAEIGEPVPSIWEKYDVQYSIIDVIYEHEKYHVRDATRYANENFDKEKLTVKGTDGSPVTKTLKEHLSTVQKCSGYIKNYDEAKKRGEEYIKNAMKEFMIFHKKKWYKGTVQINFEGEKIYRVRELFAHWGDRVQNKITKYQSILTTREGYDENTCMYHIKEWTPFKIYRNNL